jgi:para-nitrobenzyl esterase
LPHPSDKLPRMSCSSTRCARRSFLAYCASAAAAFSQEKTFVTAETESGRVRGFEQHGIKTFKGIPYGASTAGANRFMPRQQPSKWTGIRDCLEWGPSAPQSRTLAASIAQGIAPGFDGTPLPREGEDCLVLNVWTPAINSSNKRPVMFWCHGGGFYFGTASFPIYDGANLARHGDVVVVSVNHRLNVMSFC